jgi:hypothetical protein
MLRSTASAFTAAALVILTVIDRSRNRGERAGRIAGGDWGGVMPPAEFPPVCRKANQLKAKLTRYQPVGQEPGAEPGASPEISIKPLI